MGDDIGWMQPSIYHQGLMVGETPNIDRIGQEGAKFMHYYAEQSCTAGRNAFFTGMNPLRTGMIPPQLPGSPTYLRPGTPTIAWFLRDLGYNTGEFGKNHLGDHTDALPTAHGFHEFWGYLYHLDDGGGGRMAHAQDQLVLAAAWLPLADLAGTGSYQVGSRYFAISPLVGPDVHLGLCGPAEAVSALGFCAFGCHCCVNVESMRIGAVGGAGRVPLIGSCLTRWGIEPPCAPPRRPVAILRLLHSLPHFALVIGSVC